MSRRSWILSASIEATLEYWAKSLRDVKARIRPLLTQDRVAASANAFLDGLLGDERRKTGWMRAEAAGDRGPWRQQAILGRGRWKANSLFSAILALCFWFLSFFVWRYLSANGAHSASLRGTKMYTLDTHGSIVYLTAGQHYLLYGLIVAGAALFLVTALLGYWGRKRSAVVG